MQLRQASRRWSEQDRGWQDPMRLVKYASSLHMHVPKVSDREKLVYRLSLILA